MDSATWQFGRFDACEVFVAIRCQAVESVNYRVHRLATVATQLAKWRFPASHASHTWRGYQRELFTGCFKLVSR